MVSWDTRRRTNVERKKGQREWIKGRHKQLETTKDATAKNAYFSIQKFSSSSSFATSSTSSFYLCNP